MPRSLRIFEEFFRARKIAKLTGSFVKGLIPYTFNVYFPDGKFEGARGFSVSSVGRPPSTVEPFMIDERKVTPELVVFWVMKRLYAQKLLP
ncbi:hypothetical protein CBR_g51823 [Chara braunii]|uniref:Uncharacterized protein n=1 Tax=Chara braunii TaxID=69332 RepID=A0A388M9F8_CHABU|nr:hypothetical protein CBR_g51823 [Chara braunii]|eukprot:GBG91089.1 hypothetical protein CBR_g51823 [Chara braunii]